MKTVNDNRIIRRKKRISSNIVGTAKRPRITVFRSNRYIYAQAVDDSKKTTVAAGSSLTNKTLKGEKTKTKKTVEAKNVGLELAKLLKAKHIAAAVFDRGRFAYAGRVAKVAEGLREGGIKI